MKLDASVVQASWTKSKFPKLLLMINIKITPEQKNDDNCNDDDDVDDDHVDDDESCDNLSPTMLCIP